MNKTEKMQALLACPMEPNDAGATTVGGYLICLAHQVWEWDEGFSGKRPFGNSGWQHEVYEALVKNGHMKGTMEYDEDEDYHYLDYVEPDEERRIDKFILETLNRAKLVIA